MWRQYQPTEIIFGENEISRLPDLLEQYRAERVLIVADPFIEKSGLASSLAESAANRIEGIFSDIEPNPTLQNIDDCAAMIRELKADFLLAVGGGSAMDCAKSAAVAGAMGCTAGELMNGLKIEKALPIGAIPTTAGTGSEITAGAVLSDRAAQKKDAIFSPALFTKFAIVDPVLTYTCPPRVTACSGIDVLMHAVDAMSSIKANPVTDMAAIQASRLVFDNLPAAIADGQNKEARRNMSVACILAGLAFSQTGTTGSHAASYILTEKYGLPHGEACAFTADAWLEANAKACPEIGLKVQRLGFSDAEDLAAAINKLKKLCGFKTTFSEAGIPMDALREIAESTVSAGNYVNNAARLNAEEVMELFSRYQR